jgi:acyl carrier protein
MVAEGKKGGNMSDTIVNQLKDIIANKLDVNLAYDEIDENVSLFEDGLGLDSIAIVDLIVSIENTFSLSIEDEELNADLFKNLKILSEFIRNKLKN